MQICLCCLTALTCKAQHLAPAADKLPCFATSPYFGEQEINFILQPGIKVNINAPADFDKTKPTRLVFYALPNGNSIACTIGKLPSAGDDWHYHIQHIGAQTRFIREKDTAHNFVTIYVEADTRSWGRWRSISDGRDEKIKDAVESIYEMFADYNPIVELNSHSGGGNFIFGFMDATDDIPAYVKRISYIDSNYNWNDERYGPKLTRWLEASPDNCLFVACYDDANARLNGKPFISRKGGTWHRTRMMQSYLQKNIKDAKWKKTSTDSTICHTADNGRIYMYWRKNPERKIYHTVLVERNGFIHSSLVGSSLEHSGYTFMGEHAYDSYRQDSILMPDRFAIPPRNPDAPTGSEFAQKHMLMDAENRDSAAFEEIISGNVPCALRQPVFVTDSLFDLYGRPHKITIAVLPDFISIGSDDDFMRIPLLPTTAQKIADYYGAILPTRKISDIIHRHSTVKTEPHPMTPDASMTTLPVFARHDSIIEYELRTAGYVPGSLIAGHKKDIVITNRIANEPGRLFIYGWHHPDGKAIQPLSAAHDIHYVDYSHGVRLIKDEILIDDKPYSLKQILKDPVLYHLFSDEAGPMKTVGYENN